MGAHGGADLPTLVFGAAPTDARTPVPRACTGTHVVLQSPVSRPWRSVPKRVEVNENTKPPEKCLACVLNVDDAGRTIATSVRTNAGVGSGPKISIISVRKWAGTARIQVDKNSGHAAGYSLAGAALDSEPAPSIGCTHRTTSSPISPKASSTE
jgi:hypothetical protein